MNAVLTQIQSNCARNIEPVDPMTPAACRVMNRRKENHDTFTLEIAHENALAGFDFQPGQFNMLYVHGVGEVPISISGDFRKSDCIIHTTRDVGTVTRGLARLRAGDTLGIRGPFGVGWPMRSAEGRNVVIVAGGIGLAPLRPVIYQILAARSHFGQVALLYGARTPGDLLFRREFNAWRRNGIVVHETVDRADGSWRGHVGVVTAMIQKVESELAGAIGMICGPEVMIRFTVNGLRGRNMAGNDIYVSMERNMKCAVGFCGHCQYGPEFICKDGPVFPYDRIERLFAIREL